jgi:hypothetical protein
MRDVNQDHLASVVEKLRADGYFHHSDDEVMFSNGFDDARQLAEGGFPVVHISRRMARTFFVGKPDWVGAATAGELSFEVARYNRGIPIKAYELASPPFRGDGAPQSNLLKLSNGPWLRDWLVRLLFALRHERRVDRFEALGRFRDDKLLQDAVLSAYALGGMEAVDSLVFGERSAVTYFPKEMQP